MAGDWIKVEHATPDKPEVLKMAEMLETSPDDVLGKLIRVWAWFDTQSLDGHAGSVTGVTLFRFIDRLVASQGFASTMKSVGWLTDNGMPNFDNHNGESSKKRALNAKRQKKHRNAVVTLDALPEKRREEKNIKPIAVELPDWLPKSEWSAFVEMRKKGKSPFTSHAEKLALGELAKLRAAGHDPRQVLEASILNGWKSFYAPKTAPTANPWDGAK